MTFVTPIDMDTIIDKVYFIAGVGRLIGAIRVTAGLPFAEIDYEREEYQEARAKEKAAADA